MGKTILLREVNSDFGDSPPLGCGYLPSSDSHRGACGDERLALAGVENWRHEANKTLRFNVLPIFVCHWRGQIHENGGEIPQSPAIRAKGETWLFLTLRRVFEGRQTPVLSVPARTLPPDAYLLADGAGSRGEHVVGVRAD